MQILILIAIPANVFMQGLIKPFHALGYAVKTLLRNFLQFMVFFICIGLIFIVVLAIAYWSSKLIGIWGIMIYILSVWVLLTWVNLSFSYMAGKAYFWQLGQ